MANFRRSYNNGQFKTDVEEFVQVSEKRMLALMRLSIQDVVDNANTPVAKGGRMRVDTGFLRASGAGSVEGMPTGPERGDKKEKNAYSYNDGAVIAVLGKMKLGQTFYYGWTAAYARYRELYDGFLEGAIIHWDKIVAWNTDIIRERIKK